MHRPGLAQTRRAPPPAASPAAAAAARAAAAAPRRRRRSRPSSQNSSRVDLRQRRAPRPPSAHSDRSRGVRGLATSRQHHAPAADARLGRLLLARCREGQSRVQRRHTGARVSQVWRWRAREIPTYPRRKPVTPLRPFLTAAGGPSAGVVAPESSSRALGSSAPLGRARATAERARGLPTTASATPLHVVPTLNTELPSCGRCGIVGACAPSFNDAAATNVACVF